MERRLPPRPGTPRHPPRHRPRHRPHRDDHRGLRDGGDPPRAARTQRGAERGPLGLPLQPDQDLRPPDRLPTARPGRGHHDRPLHAGLHRTARTHLPPARRPGHRRDGRPRPQPGRAGELRRPRQGPPRQGTGGRGRLRRLLGGPPRTGPRLPRGLRQRPGGAAAPARPDPGGRRDHGRRPAVRPPDRRAPHTGGDPLERRRRPALLRRLAARQRRRGPLRPDGGRRDRRDRPRPDLAVAAPRPGRPGDGPRPPRRRMRGTGGGGPAGPGRRGPRGLRGHRAHPGLPAFFTPEAYTRHLVRRTENRS